MSTTLSAPNTATISLDAFGSITISSGATGTISFTSLDEGLKSSFTEKLQNRTYGAFGVPMTVVITPTSGSLSYTLNNNINANYSLDSNGNVIGLVTSNGISYFKSGKNIGTRVPFGRMGTISNASPLTWHVTAELESDFDAIRPIFASTDAARSYQHSVVKLSVLSDISSDANMINNSGTWVSATTLNQAPVPLSVAIGGSTGRPYFTTTDWIKLSSIPRTDGGSKPLIACRVYNNDTSATALPVYGNGTDDFTNWETKSDKKWFSRKFTGDGASTISNFTGGSTATPISQSVIIGFQYIARGKVFTVCGIGDSITEGRGTYLGEGFILQACQQIISETGLKVEYFNAGYSGQTFGTNGYNTVLGRALDIVNNNKIIPDVIVLPVGSPNDETTTLTSAGINNQKQALEKIVSICKDKKIGLVLYTWLPTNFAVFPRGSTDSLRVAYNAECLVKYQNICDLSSIFTGALDGNSQYTMLNTTDGIHPNDAGNILAKTAIYPYIKSAMIGV